MGDIVYTGRPSSWSPGFLVNMVQTDIHPQGVLSSYGHAHLATSGLLFISSMYFFSRMLRNWNRSEDGILGLSHFTRCNSWRFVQVVAASVLSFFSAESCFPGVDRL